MRLAPLALEPRPVARPWGGSRVGPLFGWQPPVGEPIGEWWIVSTRAEAPSRLTDGPMAGRTLAEMIDAAGAPLIGCRLSAAEPARFPLLVKLLDARELLSVQLHPSDAVRPGQGKTEAWLILDAAEDSAIYVGLADGVETTAFFDGVERGADVRTMLRSHRVRPGDVAFIPAGCIHAFGPQIVALEVQQNSDTTYRIFDWNRKPERTLHVAQAREVVAPDQGSTLVPPRIVQQTPYSRTRLVDCVHFQVDLLELSSPQAMVSDPERCWVIVPTEGQGQIESEGGSLKWRLGAAHLIPAALGPFRIHPAGRSRLVRIIPGSTA